MSNYSTRVLGDQVSVAQRFGTASGVVRPEKLLDVLCVNTSAGLLYMQVFNLTDNQIPFGSLYAAAQYTLTGLTIGHTYQLTFGPTETSIVNGANVYVSGGNGSVTTFVATATSALFNGSGTSPVTAGFLDLTVLQPTPAPVDGSIPKFSFPVQSGLGGTLGRMVDTEGIYCCWSSTQATKTIAAASGSILIVIKS